MFGALLEKGNVAAGHQIMKKNWPCSSEILEQLCHWCLFCSSVCVCLDVCSSIVSKGTVTHAPVVI